MNRYLDELESDISELRTRLDYVESSFDNMKEDFESMESKLDDIQSVIDSGALTEEEKFGIVILEVCQELELTLLQGYGT